MFKKWLPKKRLGVDDNLNSLPSEDNPEEIWQEFYCAKSGEGCGGYVRFALEVGFEGKVTMICPKCGHKHARFARDGVVQEQGRGHPDDTDALEIMPTIAAWSQEPWTKVYEKMGHTGKHREERTAAVIKSSNDLVAKEFVKQSWFAKED